MIAKNKKIKEIESLLQGLTLLLQQHDGENYISGVLTVQDLLSNSASDSEGSIAEAGRAFRRIYGGAGTLGDFSIWDSNESSRVALNKELSELISKLWVELSC